MSYLRALMSALAAAEGRARRLALYRHFYAEREPLFLLFWRPGGEEGRVAAVAWAVGRGPVQLLAAGDARNWDLQAGLLREFAGHFNPLFERPAAIRVPDGDRGNVAHSAPQVVVANAATQNFLKRAAQYVKVLPPAMKSAEVTALGQHLDFLYEMGGSPGQSLLLVMTEVLEFHNIIPVTAPERQSLSAAEATISHVGGHYSSELCSAERVLFGPLPSTEDERSLYRLVREFNQARGGETDRNKIKAFLPDIEKAYRALSERALDIMRASYYREAAYEEAGFVRTRRLEDRRRYTWHVDYVAAGRARPLQPSPWRAFRWMRRMEDDVSVFAAQAACDDPGLMAEHLVSGEAIKGRVVKSDPNHTEVVRVRAVRRPRVTVRLDGGDVAPPVGQELWLATHPKGKPWEVVASRQTSSGGSDVTLKLTTEGRTLTVPAVGDEACFVSFSAERGPLLPLPGRRPHAFGGM